MVPIVGLRKQSMPAHTSSKKGQPLSLANRVRIGMRYGVFLGIVFSVFGAIAVVVSGPASLSRYGTTLPAVIGTYLAGGALGGAFVGALLPLGRSAVGAAVIGVLTAGLIGVGIRVSMYGLAPWVIRDTLTLLLFASVVGAFGGVVARGVLLDD